MFNVDETVIASLSALYQRTEESLNEDAANLKNWMKTQSHLPEILDDKSIKNFLILNKCSVERAKQSIDMYYTLRSRIPELFENNNPKCPNIKEVLEIIYALVLPKLTTEKYRVCLFKIRCQEFVDVLDPYEVTKCVINFQELRLREDVMFGDVVIVDMEWVNLGYLRKWTLMVLTKAFAIYEKVYRIPLKNVYFINSPPFINLGLKVLKLILKPKLFERIHVCENTSILQEHFPKEIIPKDYGGEEKSLEELRDLMLLQLGQYQDRFDLLDTLRVNEDLRPEQLENDEVLGFYGNFKKLNVD